MINNKTLRDLAESWAATELDLECDAGRDSRPDRLCDKCRKELEAAIEGYIAGIKDGAKMGWCDAIKLFTPYDSDRAMYAEAFLRWYAELNKERK